MAHRGACFALQSQTQFFQVQVEDYVQQFLLFPQQTAQLGSFLDISEKRCSYKLKVQKMHKCSLDV